MNKYTVKWDQMKEYLNISDYSYFIDLGDIGYLVWTELSGIIIMCDLGPNKINQLSEFNAIYKDKCNKPIRDNTQNIVKTDFAVSNDAIELSKNDDVLIFDKTGKGNLCFLSTAVSTGEHNIRLEIDGNIIFDIDFSILSDVFKYDKNTSATPFNVEKSGGEYVFNFYPHICISYEISVKLFICSYSKNKQLDNAMIVYREAVNG